MGQAAPSEDSGLDPRKLDLDASHSRLTWKVCDDRCSGSAKGVAAQTPKRPAFAIGWRDDAGAARFGGRVMGWSETGVFSPLTETDQFLPKWRLQFMVWATGQADGVGD
jgi:hypothetical protein